jgi:hypothetical protein
MPKKHVRLNSRPTAEPHHGAHAARTIVEVNGFINPGNAPVHLRGWNGDLFVWAIRNDSGVPISVGIDNFLKKDPLQDPKDKGKTSTPAPFNWMTDNPVSIDPGKTGHIAGEAAYTFRGIPLPVELTYSIEVVSTTSGKEFEIEYDPDLEIKP